MNKRIKELAEKAGAETWSRAPMRAVTGLAFTDENLKKFAELIVRECARVYWNIDDGELHNEYVNSLKKHFGVEE